MYFSVKPLNFLLIWRRHHYQATYFDLHSAPMAIEQWRLKCHTYCDSGQPFTMVISEDAWHSHLLPSVWQRSCHLHFFKNEICPRSPVCETKALQLPNRGVLFITEIRKNDRKVIYVFCMVTYFCHHLSDKYVDLSDLYAVLSDLYIDVICLISDKST